MRRDKDLLEREKNKESIVHWIAFDVESDEGGDAVMSEERGEAEVRQHIKASIINYVVDLNSFQLPIQRKVMKNIDRCRY